MQTPAIPSDEQARLAALRSTGALDSAHEERFDRVTRLAQRLFGVPVVLVSLVDEHRQWFKSRVGLDATETPRDISFCGHAILSDDILLVNDATQDERFCDNPLVVDDPHVRFYAGCPLTTTDGHRIGTLCLIDGQPRSFSSEDGRLLRDLSLMVEQELSAIQLASIDELTTLSNRRGFRMLASRGLEVCRLRSQPASLLYFDLDNFKSINDRFGHPEGDRALRDFAGILLTSIRTADVVGRLGGDEFAVLLGQSEEFGAAVALDRIDQLVEEHNVDSTTGYRIEFSVGMSTIDGADWAAVSDPVGHLIERADAQMYEQKRCRTPAAF